LHLRLLRDDGAIVYLNGNEIFRNNMPAGAVNYLTLAATNAVGADETTNYISASVSASALGNGVNVLAVEIHQGSLTSSDLSFDFAMDVSFTNRPPSAVNLLEPADGAEYPAGFTVGLRATAFDAEGGIARVEFYAGGVRIGQATTAPYRFNWINAPAGYHVITARAFDTCGASRESAPIAVRVGAFAMIGPGATWRYLDDGSDQGVAWRESSFNDAAWSSGAAELGFGDGGEVTLINGGPAGSRFMTTYFRRAWEVPDPTVVTGLVVRLLRDDGAIVYLNGTELWRSNLPEGPVVAGTPAINSVGGADEDRFFVLTTNASALRAGRNVLAVEVHQQAPDSSDLSFDLELMGLVRPHTPRLFIEPVGLDQHQLVWPSSAAGFRLQASPQLPAGATWQNVPASPTDDGAWKTLIRPNGASGQMGFYRLGT
jgi:hypothetical protein